MSWQRRATIAFAGLLLAGCGQAASPVAVVSPIASPSSSSQASPTASPTPSSSPKPSPMPSPSIKPSPQPAPSSAAAAVTCLGAPSTAMAVVAGVFLYDVTDPVHPRLVCRANKTYMQLLEGRKIAYTVALPSGKADVIWRDLQTGANTKVGQFPADPGGAKNWSGDGALEVYAGPGRSGSGGSALLPVHLVSDGGNHVLYTIVSGPAGIESRWSQLPILEFSPNHTYFAISDARYAITSSSMRIFSVADRKQLLVTGEGPGGTWVADDRFVWSSGGGLLQWTPQGGVAPFRPEKAWFGVSSSPDGQWLAGTQLLDTATPRVQIVGASGGTPLITGLGSAPGFVSPTVLWYIGEKVCSDSDPCGYDPTVPDGTVHAYDVIAKTDVVVVFRTGEQPTIDGDFWFCCGTRI